MGKLFKHLTRIAAEMPLQDRQEIPAIPREAAVF